MHQPGWLIQTVMRVAKSEFLQHPPRPQILRMMPRKKLHCPNRFKRVSGRRAPGFFRVSLAPMNGPQVKPHFENSHFRLKRPQAAAAHEFVVRKLKNRPVLNPVCRVIRGLRRQPLFDLLGGESFAAADQPRHFGVAPE